MPNITEAREKLEIMIKNPELLVIKLEILIEKNIFSLATCKINIKILISFQLRV